MLRLTADADPQRWVPVTGSLGFKGRRHRKKAIGMLLAQLNQQMGVPAGRGVTAWMFSQAAPFLLRKADGRVLVWVYRDDPELLVAMAQIQEATAQLRTARAMMPMEYDDTESFANPHLGVGERLVLPMNPTPSATYTWDTGSHFVTLTAVGPDRERFGTITGTVDELARTLRIVDELAVGESPTVLRIDPA
ncbi:MAG: hypothetical protein ACK5IN_04210 [Microbacterium sp.]|uniref:hypothetical protein n=1 Tax=Microbacterium sp. TaxID=51671 RepID=UPI003A871079